MEEMAFAIISDANLLGVMVRGGEECHVVGVIEEHGWLHSLEWSQPSDRTEGMRSYANLVSRSPSLQLDDPESNLGKNI